MPSPMDVRLTVPARSDYSRVVHLVADSVASRADLDVDRLDDIETAVDEVIDALTSLAGTSELECSLRSDRSGLDVEISTDGDLPEGGLRLDRLRTVVLNALADRVTMDRRRARLSLRFETRTRH